MSKRPFLRGVDPYLTSGYRSKGRGGQGAKGKGQRPEDKGKEEEGRIKEEEKSMDGWLTLRILLPLFVVSESSSEKMIIC